MTQPYFVDGRRVPSVTTILGKFKDPGALMYWSWNTAFSVLQEAVDILGDPSPPRCEKFLRTHPLDRGNFRKVSAKATTAGTIAHNMVESWIHSGPQEQRALEKKTASQIASDTRCGAQAARQTHNAFSAFREWVDTNHFEMHMTEIPLISEEHLFGGTIDCVGTIGDEWVILDWKTSKALYVDYIVQVAAYKILYDENYVDPIDTCHLVRFDKETADFEHRSIRSAEVPQEAFLCLRRAYDLFRVMEKKE